MANQNIVKMLNALGGGASESYGQGSMLRQGGQPILPKPQMSMPDALSPYAPGNQQGGPFAHQGAMAAPNKTKGVQHTEMNAFEPTHPVRQLASYLATRGGSAARRQNVDPAAVIRGQRSMPGVTAGVRG